MGACGPISVEAQREICGPSTEGPPALDSAVSSAPDYGTLGPDSDVTDNARGKVAAQHYNKDRTAITRLAAIAACVGLGLAAGTMTKPRVSRNFASVVAAQPAETIGGVSRRAPAKYQEAGGPQEQAESLLEAAIGNADGANEKIAERAEHWRGKLSLDSQLETLTTAALNSNDLRVREAGIEVQLAAYGLAKNSSSVDALILTADSSGHARKIWALWALGALANRGIERNRAEMALVQHLKDADEVSRRWAVEGLSLVGTTTTVAPLLAAMHNDPSPAVRERAACSLAESGMLSHEQRLTAVPQLVNYTADSSLDPQTHTWVYQALGDITKERLPNDPAAWRSWYASSNIE